MSKMIDRAISLDLIPQPTNEKLIDLVGVDNWYIYTGDKRDYAHMGKLSNDPRAISYHFLNEADIAKNQSIPLSVRFSLWKWLTRQITELFATWKQGRKFGIKVNISKHTIIRTMDCKADIQVIFYRHLNGLYAFDILRFSQDAREHDTLAYNPHYKSVMRLVIDSNGDILATKKLGGK